MAIVRPDLADVEAAIRAVLPDAEVLRIKQARDEPPVSETERRLTSAPVLDLRKARFARADQLAEAEFQKALNRAQQVQKTKFKTTGGAPVLKIVGGSIATSPARCLVWALSDHPKALPQVLRRYSVEGELVRLIYDKPYHEAMRVLAEWQQARLRNWLEEEPDEADYWR